MRVVVVVVVVVRLLRTTEQPPQPSLPRRRRRNKTELGHYDDSVLVRKVPFGNKEEMLLNEESTLKDARLRLSQEGNSIIRNEWDCTPPSS